MNSGNGWYDAEAENDETAWSSAEYLEEISTDSMEQIARDVFGIKYLTPWQHLVIADILDSVNDSTVEKHTGRVVLLPTGAGKSLCFMVPAMMLPRPTLIIYPLLALMADQERRLKEAKVDCVVLRGEQSAAERERAYRKMKTAHIIITNPEMLAQENTLRRIMECGISHIAIDEAHCVSEWGDSFRPAYLELGKVIKMINAPVVTAFTATASDEVLRRVSKVLFKDEWANIAVIRSEADRPNLHYFVLNACNKVQSALELTCTQTRPMLIFCGTRRRAENMAREVCALHGYGTARFYHAGMTRGERQDTEEWFFNSNNGVLAATCAYGMGVDKKNIRTVIHLDAPATAEAYLQEAGRGGRDGGDMNAILLWSPSDTERFGATRENSRGKVMLRYAVTNECRRQVLLDAIGGESAICSGCDNCGAYLTAAPAWDGGEALRLVARNRSRYNMRETDRLLVNRMNAITEKTLGLHTWNIEAARAVMTTLSTAGLVKERGGLWKGCVTVTGAWKTAERLGTEHRNRQQNVDKNKGIV